MKNKLPVQFLAVGSLALLSTLNSHLSTCFAQSTAFTYQGRLDASGAPYTGTAEFQPTLWDAAANGVQVSTNNPASAVVNVTNGLFVLPLDFGDHFPGADRWVQLEVRTTLGPFTTLVPRQQVTPAPYAITAGSLPGLRVQPNTNGSPNLIGGSPANFVQANVVGATIGGGGASYYSGLVLSNSVTGSFGTVAGGADNTVGNFSTVGGGYSNRSGGFVSTVGGGEGNVASGSSVTVSGGYHNSAGGNGLGDGATVSGGERNSAGNSLSTVGGGTLNVISAVAATVGGGSNNVIQSGADYATIGGGSGNTANGNTATVGGGDHNIAGGITATVSGGSYNSVSNSFSTVGGGTLNLVGAFAATVAGGSNNVIQSSYADYATIGGGSGNTAEGGGATVSGGQRNAANAAGATVGGGNQNTANGSAATVSGGLANIAAGTCSMAAGALAHAMHDGTFVWADYSVTPFNSTAINQFLIRASGGVGIGTASPQGPLHVQGNRTGSFATSVAFAENTSAAPNAAPALRVVGWGNCPNGVLSVSGNGTGLIAQFGNYSSFVGDITTNGTFHGLTFSPTSDRNAKENFEPLDPHEVLEKVASLPLTRWNYKAAPGEKHLGPMAQDFQAAFHVGTDDKHIATVDADGVALAAIQGLNRKLEVRSEKFENRNQNSDDRIQKLEAENAEMKKQLDELKQLLLKLSAKDN